VNGGEMDAGLTALAIASAVGCGLVGGVFFAFSTFVMEALRRRPAAEGIAAMQTINVTVITPLFIGALFGTAIACLAVAAWALADWDGSRSALLVTGAALYVAGNILVTMRFNVPRNDALAAVDPASGEGSAYWHRYVTEWTAWNHVRTITALAASALLIVAVAAG
jgi:uncharacterized membrane protein